MFSTTLLLPLPPPPVSSFLAHLLHYYMALNFSSLRCLSPCLFKLHSAQKLLRMALSILIFILPFSHSSVSISSFPTDVLLHRHCNSLQIDLDLYVLYYDQTINRPLLCLQSFNGPPPYRDSVCLPQPILSPLLFFFHEFGHIYQYCLSKFSSTYALLNLLQVRFSQFTNILPIDY